MRKRPEDDQREGNANGDLTGYTDLDLYLDRKTYLR